MTKAIIIDHESRSAGQLSVLLQRYCDDSVQLVGSYSALPDALNGIKSQHPRLIFIDAMFHQANGDKLFNGIASSCDLVFCSDKEQYAYHAFKHNAVDYLLKPFDPKRLITAVDKAIRKRPSESLGRKYDSLLGNIEQLKQYTPPKKIMVPTSAGFELLPVIDILRCQSDINYTTIFLKDRQKLVVAKTLKEFEEMLSAYNFFRVHNSHLVNLAYIKSYNRGKGGSVVLIDGTELEVSTRRKDEFLQRMAQM